MCQDVMLVTKEIAYQNPKPGLKIKIFLSTFLLKFSISYNKEVINNLETKTNKKC